MVNILWLWRRVAPVLCLASLMGATSAIATEAETDQKRDTLWEKVGGIAVSDLLASETPEWVGVQVEEKPIASGLAVPQAEDSVSETLSNYAAELTEFKSLDTMEQVTSISQLRDVQPTDWAFQALQSLVERYGCIAGYPDGTYRGNRALTRYEFAAGLNACLDRIVDLIDAATRGIITQEDLLVIQRLQEEFAAELATLRGRVDALEARTAELEANQFSTTTKLSGLAFFHLTGAFADGDIRREVGQRVAVGSRDRVVEIADDPNTTYSGLVWLNLNTSFTGRDLLVTQLAVGNGNSPANVYASAGLFNTFGVPFVEQGTDNNTVILRELFYDFPVTDRLRLVVGPRVNWYRYFDNNAYTFFLTGAGSFNSSGGTQLNSVDRGAGAVLLWDISRAFKLRLGYLGESTEFLPNPPFGTASNPNRGLFNATNTATAELTFSPSDRANFRFLYTRSNIQQVGGRVGGAISEPFYGIADDGFGGPIGDATADTFSFNFDWRVARYLGLFGRYAYGSTNIYPRTGRPDGEINAQSYQIGVAFPDLGRRGALGTISFLVPFDVLSGRRYLVSGGGNGGTQYEIEATYYLPLTPNIALVPAFYVIGNPNNFDNNSTIYVGNLRTQFSF
ncbi:MULTISPECIES: iron uptake porin [Desertifilum]|uniref:iron uptake porin n=1 Tax=Desertifilum TaxID=1185872 RepID=UPI000A5F9A1E|nr:MULTISPECIES: iron uptake porin [Desertifilum]